MFKKVIVGAVIAIASVGAIAHVYVSSNDGGGSITLSDTDSRCTTGVGLITTDTNNDALHGCAIPNSSYNGQFDVEWENGRVTTLFFNGFRQIN
jgi:hypothetical protein